MRTRTPEELYDRFRLKGDPSALAELFDLVAPELLAVARHLVRDPAHAEDAVQATFVTAIERAASFQAGRPVLPWLLGVLANKAKELYRAKTRTPDPERLGEREVDGPSAPLEALELRDAVEQAIADLPAPYDRVLRLHLAEGLAPSAIASRIDERAGTVRVQLHRGLNLLRRALPAGLVAGASAQAAPLAAGAGTTNTGLAAVRAAVLERAASHGPGVAPALASTSSMTASGGFLAGVLMASKTTLSLIGLAALAGGLAYVVTRDPAPLQEETAHPAVPSVAVRPSIDRELVDVDDPSGQAPAQNEPVRAAIPVAERTEPSPERAAPSRPARIVGRVIDRASKTPVVGATVELWVSLPSPGNITARTDDEGRFDFDADGVEARSMRVTGPGYAPFQGVPWYSDRNGEPLRVEDETYDLGELTLEPGVFVSGRVLDEDGQGIGGADLFRFPALPPSSLARGVQPRSEGRTDASGGFELADLLPYSGSQGYPYALVACTDDGIAWANLEMLAGEGESRWFELVQRSGATLDVQAFDENGSPLIGASVRLQPTFPPFQTLAPFWEWKANHRVQAFFVGTTKADGSVRFKNLPVPEGETSGAYRVQLIHRGEVGAVESASPSTRGANRLRLDLHRTGASRVRGFVLDHFDRPLAGAGVHVEGEKLGSSSTTGRRGQFDLRLLTQPGAYVTLIASAEGYGARAQQVRLGWEAGGIEQDPSRITFRLSPRHPISGQVVDDNGAPVPGAYVALFTDREETQTLPGRSGHRSDEEGRFHFPEAGEGTWYLVASPPFGSGVSNWRGSSRVRVMGGMENVRIVLTRRDSIQASVEVELFDHATGARVDAEDVRVMSRAPFFGGDIPHAAEVERRTGEVYVDGLARGPWRIWVASAEHRPAFIDVEVESSEPQRHRLDLGADAAITGRVVLPPGEELRGQARVTYSLTASHAMPFGPAWEGAPDAHGMVDVAADRTFRIDGLGPGAYHVRFHHGYLLADAYPTLVAGETAELELTSSVGSWVSFTGTEPAEPGFVRLQASTADGSWESPVRYVQRKEGILHAAMIVPAGAVRWEVRFRPEGASNREPERLVTSSFNATPGVSLDVLIPAF